MTVTLLDDRDLLRDFNIYLACLAVVAVLIGCEIIAFDGMFETPEYAQLADGETP